MLSLLADGRAQSAQPLADDTVNPFFPDLGPEDPAMLTDDVQAIGGADGADVFSDSAGRLDEELRVTKALTERRLQEFLARRGLLLLVHVRLPVQSWPPSHTGAFQHGLLSQVGHCARLCHCSADDPKAGKADSFVERIHQLMRMRRRRPCRSRHRRASRSSWRAS